MALMSLVDLSQADMDLLKSTAIQALNMAVIEHRHLTVYGNIPEVLMSVGASFVTLLKEGQLRGCIGTLDAYRPIIEDIAGNSYSAAMQDPRFPAVVVDELDELELSLSVLSTPQELNIESETQLQRSIRPGIDGVILQEGMSLSLIHI